MKFIQFLNLLFAVRHNCNLLHEKMLLSQSYCIIMQWVKNIFPYVLLNIHDTDRAVGIATGYGPDDRGVGV
jgi:hypothetical protein